MNRTTFSNQALLFVAFLLFAAVGRAAAQDDESSHATDPLPGASARPVTRGTAIDSARARYQEADQLVRERAESLRKLSLGSNAGRDQKSVAGANWILLQEAVARAFKARQELLRLEIVEFETRLERLKGRLADRERSQQTIIDRRVEELLDPSLRWEPDIRNEASPVDRDAAGGESGTLAANPKKLEQSASSEPTFDGVEYSQWLKMLETERKPEKLAMAMDASARLALPGDEPRIVRGIFLAARSFESANAKEQNQVWDAGWAALNRLPAAAVVDELIVAVRDQKSYTSGRAFQERFVAEKMSGALIPAARDRADEIIAELVKLAAAKGTNAGWLIAAASAVWRHSARPLKDFDGLEPLVLKTIDDGFSMKVVGWEETVPREWMIVATNVVEKAPETPGLAMMLMKHARQSTQVLGLIGKMGRIAEPLVPLLVDQFLDEWKKYEAEIREEAKLDDPNDRPQRSQEERIRAHFRRVLPLQAIGEIGVGAKGYALLRDLKAISPPRREWSHNNEPASPGLYETVDQAFARFSPPAASEPIPLLLSDFWFIAGKWKLRALIPGDTPPNLVAEIRKTYLSWDAQSPYALSVMKATGTPSSSHQFEIDETKSPKQITFLHKKEQNIPSEYRAEGIYELTREHLKIELAKPGQARPKEFSPDKEKRPEGRVVLKFDRELPSEKDRAASGTTY